MLIMARRQDEEICIGGEIVVRVRRIGRKRVALVVEAPEDMVVYRQEQIERRFAPRQPKLPEAPAASVPA